MSHRSPRPAVVSTCRHALDHLRARLIPAATFAVAATLAGVGTASAADRVETPIASTSEQSDVVSSVVRIRVPLPADAGARPAACDWISYERFRPADGPSDATESDAVAVLMPGLIEGATAFDPVARNTIRESKRRGRNVEVWAVDRRSNCLEDHTGIEATEASGDIESMLGYYYGKKPIDGKTFAGWNRNERFLAELGVAQTVRDYHAILTNELPSQPWRESHVICGGHSMGGPLTEVFASWDFDGNAATTDDAGYRQCAGFMGFDTRLSGSIKPTGASDPFTTAMTGGLLAGARDVTLSALRSGIAPRSVDLLGIGPETMSLLEAVGYLAQRDPDADWSPIVSRVPKSPTTDAFFHISGSPDFTSYLLSKDSMRDIRYSYAGALGQILDDNGAVFGLVRSSFGFFDSPFRINYLPQQLSGVPLLGTFVTPGRLVLPQRLASKPLVGWRNYDELGSDDAQLGKGWTTPAGEVTDFADLTRILHEGPLSLTENYFPIRLLLDLNIALSGDRSKELVAMRYPDGVTKKPRFVVLAGDGLRAKSTPATDPSVTLPGYQHLDVLTASERQNSGQPEGSSQAFADLIDQAVGN